MEGIGLGCVSVEPLLSNDPDSCTTRSLASFLLQIQALYVRIMIDLTMDMEMEKKSENELARSGSAHDTPSDKEADIESDVAGGEIDHVAERKLMRKVDLNLITLMGVCVWSLSKSIVDKVSGAVSYELLGQEQYRECRKRHNIPSQKRSTNSFTTESHRLQRGSGLEG